MDTQDHSDKIGKPFHPEKIIFNFDDDKIDFDEISFRPINQGLGFHQKEEGPKALTRIQNPRPLNTKTTHRPITEVPEVSLPPMQKRTEVKKVKETIARSVIADPWERAMAFIIDNVLITAALAIISYLSLEFSHLSVMNLNFKSPYVLGAFLGVYSLLYIFYFSILDISETPGKSIFGIKVEKVNNKKTTLMDTFPRSIVSLLSMILLFFPLMFELQDKLTDTKVTKNVQS